ncbi:uncharacterized protein N7459_003462 [Penicillium hispanicum]|uniref:uncharacterized protein n=1 Tax=Penicillium hispanicum TaxID=1080232 RepID=UPI0025410CFB|nr:uncharacterized protein N7459_003462 [Penicillium hispanicum]KAJ5587697.1 hypothetical protein N7459_003462 [Penicillium hispanicum]
MSLGLQSLPISPQPVRGDAPSLGNSISHNLFTQSFSPLDIEPSMRSNQSIAPVESRSFCTPPVLAVSPAVHVLDVDVEWEDVDEDFVLLEEVVFTVDEVAVLRETRVDDALALLDAVRVLAVDGVAVLRGV